MVAGSVLPGNHFLYHGISRTRLPPYILFNMEERPVDSIPTDPVRRRFRQWAFTVHVDTDDRAWDPATLSFNSLGFKYMCAGLETCPTTGSLHWQGFISCGRAMDLSTVKTALECPWVHLDNAKGSAAQNYAYVTKSDTGVCYDDDSESRNEKIVFEAGERPDISKKISKDEAYRQMLQQPDFESALAKIEELAPKDFVVYNNQIRKILMDRFMKNELFIREMSTFCRAPVEQHYLNKLSICLLGLSGTGKTAYALAHFKNPKMITHVDDLKQITPANDGLVFDDISFGHWPVTTCIQVVDLEYNRSIHLRHVNAVIPKNMPRFFCSNEELSGLFNIGDPYGQHAVAIKRRCMIINIHKNLF